MLREALGLARVDFDAESARAAWHSLSVAAPGSYAVGWTQADAVQACCQLAMLRDSCAAWRYQRIAGFTESRYVRTVTAHGRAELGRLASKMQAEGLGGVYVFGDAPIFAPPAPPGPGLENDWHALLARACDHVLQAVATSKVGPEVPAIAQPGALFVMVPAIPIAIIVRGAVLGVIAAVAVWRYLDPDLRSVALAVRAASEAYQERLAVLEESGTMPPPSPIELASADVVRRAADTRGSSALWFGVGVAGGITVGTLAAGAISRAVAA